MLKKLEDSRGICLVKNLEILKAWSNSEIKLKREQQNLEVEQIRKQMLELQDKVLYLQGSLKQKNQENLELLNLNKACQNEIKSLQDSKEDLTNKYKSEINGLKSRLTECRSDAKFFEIISWISVIALVLISIYIWSLYLQKP